MYKKKIYIYALRATKSFGTVYLEKYWFTGKMFRTKKCRVSTNVPNGNTYLILNVSVKEFLKLIYNF